MTLEQECLKELRKWKFKDSQSGREFWSIEPEEEIDLFIKTAKKWLARKYPKLDKNNHWINLSYDKKTLDLISASLTQNKTVAGDETAK